MTIKKIGILTSGGDCAGLNAIIKGAANQALSLGIEPYLIPNGYAGLYNLIDFKSLLLLDAKRLEGFPVYMAGSEAGNSRVKISKIEDKNKYNRIRQGLEKFKLDALVIAGGDDTGSVAVDLSSQGLPCVHTPKTMDLDLMSYSVGGDSTINRIAQFARDLRTTGETHNRIIVMEVFGRYAGHTAFRGGIGADADVILLPEIQVNFDLVYKHCIDLLKARIKRSDNFMGMVLVLVAEGMKDATGSEIVDKDGPLDSFGHKPLIGAGKYVVKELEARIKKDESIKTFMQETGQFIEGIYKVPEVREIRPGHLVRCGASNVIDISFGLEVGAAAIHLIQAGIFGATVVSFRGGEIEYMDSTLAIKQRHVDLLEVSMYEGLGICFGRERQSLKPRLLKIEGTPRRPH